MQTTGGMKEVSRKALGCMLIGAGTSHLTVARTAFRAQVPPWVPLETDTVVLLSGVAEISLGAALLLMPGRKEQVGRVAGAFFAAVFPGNIAQYTEHRSAFGLNTDRKRFLRLFMQPVLVGWALWSTSDRSKP